MLWLDIYGMDVIIIFDIVFKKYLGKMFKFGIVKCIFDLSKYSLNYIKW